MNGTTVTAVPVAVDGPRPAGRLGGPTPVRALLAGLAVAAAAVLAVRHRDALGAAVAAVRGGDPVFLVAGLVVVVLSQLNLAGMYAAGLRAAGEPARWPAAVRPALGAQLLNATVKSGGLAGAAAFLRHRGADRPRGPVLAGYVLATVAAQVGFGPVLVAALLLVTTSGRLSAPDVAAAVLFAAYTAGTVAGLVAATRGRAAVRALYELPGRLLARAARRRPPDPTDRLAEADALVDAVLAARRSPARAAPVLLHALLAEVLAVGLLWVVLAAVHQPVGPAVPVVAYAVSVLFSTVAPLPGGLGVAELSLGAVLVSAGVPAPTAVAVVGLYRLADLWLPAAAGALALSAPRRRPAAWTPAGRRRLLAATATGLAGGAALLALMPAGARTARWLLLAGAVALATSVPGLLRGKRQAWWLAAAGTAVGVAGLLAAGHGGLGAGSAATAGAVLAYGRSAAAAPADPLWLRRAGGGLAVGALAAYAYCLTGLLLLDGQLRDAAGGAGRLGDAAGLLVGLPPARIQPVTGDARWFLDSARLLLAAVVVAAVHRLLRPAAFRAARGGVHRQQVRAILDAYGTTSLAWFHLADDKSWVFSPDGLAFVGFTVVGDTVVVLGGPVGAPGSRLPAARALLDTCDGLGLRVVFHQVTPGDAAELAPLGLRSLVIGEEAVVDLAGFGLGGGARRGLRRDLHRLEREGVTVTVVAPPVPEPVLDELAAVSDAWLGSGGHRERGFTLGRFDRDALRDETVLVARSAGGRAEAFVDVLPRLAGDQGNFDLMRRRPDSPRGVMDLLLVSLVEVFRGQGLTSMSLGLAPLSGMDGDGPVARALRVVRDHGGRAFHFDGLRRYKEKWATRWEPRLLLYRHERELPVLALAVVRAGELDRHPVRTRVSRLARRAAGTARRLPASAALVTVVLGLQVADTLRPGLHEVLLRALGLSWPDLVAGELWRVPTAVLLQAGPSVTWSIVALLAVPPLAELRLGSRRTVALFFLSDWLSTLPVLVTLRVAGALGNGGADALATTRDAGSSSALLGLLAAWLTTLPPRPRRAGLAVLAAALLARVALDGRLFDYQHLLAAVVGAALATGWRRRAGAATAPREPAREDR